MQDVFFIAIWYVADAAYAAYAVWNIAKDCQGEHACVIRDSLEFLGVTALASLVFSPIYAIPMILSVLLRMPWLLTIGFMLNAGVILIGETIAYLSRFTTPHHVSPSQSP
jgi:uncharacterized membrane protein YgdD (TMEM256/DUF423 family)